MNSIGMLFAAVIIGAMRRPIVTLLPLLACCLAALWLHAWLPFLIGVGVAILIAGVAGADWIRNGAH